MANHASRAQAPQPRASAPTGNGTPLEDRAPKSRVIYEYDVPDDDDGLYGETTINFGSIRKVGLKLLTPLEEKSAARSCHGDAMLLAFELAKRSVAEITNEHGEIFAIRVHDSSVDECWHQMHPKIRSLVMQAYAENASPSNGTTSSFLGSRKIKA